jgi:hypothetical protein
MEISFLHDESQEIAIPVNRSAVLFASNQGFHGVVGTGEFHVRQFGIINESYDAIGAYFGDAIGKVRVYRRNETRSIGLYVLVPPIECDTFWITTAGVDTFSIGREGMNQSMKEGSTVCLWYVHPGPTVVEVSHEGGVHEDAFRYYLASNASVGAKPGTVRINAGITLWVYRCGNGNGSMRLDFRSEGRQEFPVVHARLSAMAPDVVLYAERRSLGFPVGEVDGKGARWISADGMMKITSWMFMGMGVAPPVLLLRPGVWVPQPAAEAPEKGLRIAQDAALSRLRPIADGPNQWDLHRSSVDTDGSGVAMVGTESSPGLGARDTSVAGGHPSQT